MRRVGCCDARQVLMRVTYTDGTHAEYKVLPALARDALWLGHLPRDLDGVEGLLTGHPPAAVRSFRLASSPPGWFKADIPVEFARLPTDFARADEAR